MSIEGAPTGLPGRVHASVTNGIGWLVLDNPAKRNAISLAMWRSVSDALGTFVDDAAVRCVVIRGEGEQAFCAGADVAEKQNIDADQTAKNNEVTLAGLKAVQSFPRPTLAMVSGFCMGAGINLALACDMRIAGDNAVFSVPAARLGLAVLPALLKRLTDAVGPGRAKQIIYTADRFSAAQALQMGLANEVVPSGELLAVVTAIAHRIAQNAPLTIAAAKYAIETYVSNAPDLAGCDERVRACLASADYAEGRRAFAEKRPPLFQGR